MENFHFSDVPHSHCNLTIKCNSVDKSISLQSIDKKFESFLTYRKTNSHCNSSHFGNDPHDDLFRDTVEKILLHLNHVKHVRLACADVKANVITSWISAVLRQHKTESVDLNIDGTIGNVVLPCSLLSCTSLKKLEVNIYDCSFKVPAKSCFPNLRTLVLQKLQIVNELSSTDTVTLTFPVLDSLTLFACEWSKVKYVEFLAPSMTTFHTMSMPNANVDDYSIKIVGSKLANFNAPGFALEKFILTDTTVASAHVDIAEMPFQQTDAGRLGDLGCRVRKLLKEFSSLQGLGLSDYALEAIVQSKTSFSLPKFPELKTMSLTSQSFGLYVDGLLEILHASPFLASLRIGSSNVYEYDYDAIVSVPPCIQSHLKEITFSYSAHVNSQFHLEKFLLKNALELKNVRLSIFRCNGVQREETVKQQSALPRGSKSLTVELGSRF